MCVIHRDAPNSIHVASSTWIYHLQHCSHQHIFSNRNMALLSAKKPAEHRCFVSRTIEYHQQINKMVKGYDGHGDLLTIDADRFDFTTYASFILNKTKSGTPSIGCCRQSTDKVPPCMLKTVLSLCT